MSDEELYQSITDICFENGGVTKPMADKLMLLVKQHREAYAIEARLDELENNKWLPNEAKWIEQEADRIAELKAQQEEV